MNITKGSLFVFNSFNMYHHSCTVSSVFSFVIRPTNFVGKNNCVSVLRCVAYNTPSKSGAYYLARQLRFYGNKNTDKKSVASVKVSSEVGAPTTYEQVKETTKTATYWGIVIAGFGLTGVLFYAIFNELFSSKSPNSVYGRSLERCLNEPRIKDALGEPIKGFGEETRRGRRRHVSHLNYERDGKKYLRMKFYLQGIRQKATVHLEMMENDRGKFEYRYLFAQLDDYPRNSIILEDNRYNEASSVDIDKAFETL
uniref:Mitochondrial import inner membrane translocase subunit Tim21 n=1 Tax=Timema poppense TaxID=170557 RepID=A0A7R9DFR8_TIMPO|nr:unnamed protein product [Timema poppensis]